MKKILFSLLCGLMLIPFITGCGKNEEKPNFEVLDSKVKYVVVKGRKIYIATHFTDLFKQFEGLGCYVLYGGEKSVDDIIKNNEIEQYRQREIVCYTNEEKNSLTGAVRIGTLTNSINNYQEVDLDGIYHLSFSGDNFDVVTDNGTVLFGDTDREDSSLQDALKVFGDNYEIEESSGYSKFDSYIFKENGHEFSFSYNKDRDYIANFYFTVD